ncbi:hypothetical protein D3C87_96650 [compost metagenome]
MTQTSTNLITVNEGRTLVYLFPAVFCGLGAIISFLFSLPLTIILTSLVILLSLVETGLDYNPFTQKIRRYKSLFGKKWGIWRQVANPEKFDLRLSVERAYSNYAFSQVGSPGYGRRSTEIAKSITYDLSYSTSKKKATIIYEFQKYKIAKQFIEQLEELNQQPVTDHIAIKLQENLEKRMQRMQR